MRWLCALACLWLTACGFQPIYASPEPGAASPAPYLKAIHIDAPDSLEGSRLRATLEDRFNPSADSTAPDYTLRLSLESQASPFIFEPDGTASRYEILMTSHYTLVRRADNKPVYEGRSARYVSYNVSEDDDYATFVSRKDAYRRGITELSEDISHQITAAMAQLMRGSES